MFDCLDSMFGLFKTNLELSDPMIDLILYKIGQFYTLAKYDALILCRHFHYIL